MNEQAEEAQARESSPSEGAQAGHTKEADPSSESLTWTALAFLALIQFAHYFARDELAWDVGWSAHDAMITVMAWWLFYVVRGARLRSALLLFAFYRTWILFANLGALGVDLGMLGAEWQGWFYVVEAGLFMAWFMKQMSILPRPQSDPYTPDHYMIVIKPPDDCTGLCNTLHPLTFVLYGGRAVIAGDKVWRVKGSNGKYSGRFIEQPFMGWRNPDLVYLDTGIPINSETNARLSRLIGKRWVPILQDCGRLRPGINVVTLAWKKFWR